jgi:ParB-like chromosome segregation protein Spo0J
MKTKNIPLRDITIDKEVLIRSEIDKDHLEDLVDAMKESKELPPVVVFADGENFILVDGLHRYRAAQKCNWDRIEAKVHEGSKREATLFACGVNAGHG